MDNRKKITVGTDLGAGVTRGIESIPHTDIDTREGAESGLVETQISAIPFFASEKKSNELK